jgi:hypothetical protein
MVWKRSRRRACSILLVRRGLITWPLTKKFSTERCNLVPAVTKQLIKNRQLIPSAPPRPAAQLFPRVMSRGLLLRLYRIISGRTSVTIGLIFPRRPTARSREIVGIGMSGNTRAADSMFLEARRIGRATSDMTMPPFFTTP